MYKKILFVKPYYFCYEDSDDAKKKAEEEAAKKKPDETNEDDIPESVKGKTTLTQDEFNKALKEDRLKHRAKIEKSIKELDQLRQSKTLSDKDRESLKSRIDELQNSLLTKEQLAVKERERLESQHKQTVAGITGERDMWERRFKTSQINTSIVSEASKAEAFDTEAFIKILGPDARLVEEMDAEGKPTDRFITKIKFNDNDAEGKAVQLDLTVPEVIKRMLELPRYGYLFKSKAKGGLGTTPPAGDGSKPDVSKMTPEQYREHRKKQGLNRQSY